MPSPPAAPGEHEFRILRRHAAQKEWVSDRKQLLGLPTPVLDWIKNAGDQPPSAPRPCFHETESVPAQNRKCPGGKVDRRQAGHQVDHLLD